MRLHSDRLTIGADPEFLIINPITQENEYPNFEYGDYKSGSIGCDGSSAELRPAWGYPADVVSSMRFLLTRSMDPKGVKEYNDIYKPAPYYSKLMAAGGGDRWDCSVGGHIHFGFKFDRAGNYSTSNEEMSRVGSIMDKFLGRPLQLMEGGSRSGRSYGWPSDFRTDHAFGVEYRTPPSWITCPGFAEAVLSVAYLLADRIIRDVAFLNAHSVIGERGSANWVWPEQLATDSDYASLVPEGIYHDHWNKQVMAFIDYLRGGFKLDSLEMRERWLAPIVLPWKPGSLSIDLMAQFNERVLEVERENQARLERERQAQLERERLAAAARAERLRQEEADRLARQQREAIAAAARHAAELQNAEPLAIERTLWNNEVHLMYDAPALPKGRNQAINTNMYHAVVVLHTNLGTRNDEWSAGNDVVTVHNRALRVGSLRVVMQEDYRSGFHRMSIRKGRYRRAPIERGVLYLSSDLRPLIKRSRSSRFKIKFVKLSANNSYEPRSALFIRDESIGLTFDGVISLFQHGQCKRRVPNGFYGYETRNQLPLARALEMMNRQVPPPVVAPVAAQVVQPTAAPAAPITNAVPPAPLVSAANSMHDGAPRFSFMRRQVNGNTSVGIFDRMTGKFASFGTNTSYMLGVWNANSGRSASSFVSSIAWSTNRIDISTVTPLEVSEMASVG